MTNVGRLGPYSVNRAGYGAMQLVPSGGRSVTRADAVAVLRRAVELGVDHIDTAHFYGDGAVNELIHEALAPYADTLVLATKVGATRDGSGALVAAQRPAQLREQVHANLASLGVQRLDVVNLRRLDMPPGILAGDDQRVDIDEQLAELTALRDAGLIGAIGLSNVDADHLRRALPVGVACVQNRYNLLERENEALLEQCATLDIAWVPFVPLGSAFEGTAAPASSEAAKAVAARLGVSAAQVCLAWLLARDPHVLLIAGTTSIAHLESNVAAADVALDAEALRVLDAAAQSSSFLSESSSSEPPSESSAS